MGESSYTMSLIEVLFAGFLYAGLATLFALVVWGGLIFWRADGRIPVGFPKIRYIEPPQKMKPYQTVGQKVFGAISMVVGAAGVVSSLVGFLNTLS